MRDYSYKPTDAFAKKLRKIQRSDPAGHGHLVETISRLLKNPEGADGKMQGAHRGKLKKYVGRSGYRLIYNWCTTCRKANDHLKDACDFCDTIPDDSVVFYDVFNKNEANRLGYA